MVTMAGHSPSHSRKRKELTMFCPKCGSALPDDVAFCVSCGAQLPQKQQPASETSATLGFSASGGNNKKIIVAIVTAIVVVIAIIVGVVSCNSGFKGADSPQELCKKVDLSLNQAAYNSYSEKALNDLANELLGMTPPGFTDAYCTGKGMSKEALKSKIKNSFAGLSSEGKYPFYRLSEEASSDRIDSINSQLSKIGYNKRVSNAFFIEAYIHSINAHLSTPYRAVLVDGKWFLYDASLF